MQRALRLAEQGTERAHGRALRDTARWAGRQSASRLAKANRIPVRALTRGRLGKRGRVRITKGEEGANVWVGTYPVKASYLGPISQTIRTRAIRVGRHSFPGAFVARMPSGHVGVFKREGKSRLPIVEQAVELDGARKVKSGVEREIPMRFRELLRQAVRFEQLKYQGRL